MPKKIAKICWTFGSAGMRLALVLCSVAVLLVGGLIWRVSVKPLDISFAKNTIESALKDPETGNYAVMDRVVLYWPDLSGPLYIELRGADLKNKEDETILSINKAAFSFSRSGLLLGKVLPKVIILKEPTLRILRAEDGEISVALGTPAEDKDAQAEAVTTKIFEYISRPGQDSAHDSIVARLRAISISNARLIVDDRIEKQSWSLPDFNAKFRSTSKGMIGTLDVPLTEVGGEKSKLHASVTYAWDQKNVEVDAEIDDLNTRALAQKLPIADELPLQDVLFDAHVKTTLDENFMPAELFFTFSSEEGALSHPDWRDEPVPYKGMELGVVYNHEKKMLDIERAQLTIDDVAVTAQAQLTHDETRVSGPVSVQIDTMPQGAFDRLWPTALRGDSSEEWLVEKMNGGVFKDLKLAFTLDAKRAEIGGDNAPEDVEPQAGDVSLPPEEGAQGADLVQTKAEPETSWSVDTPDLLLDFKFEGVDLDYRNPLDVAKNLYGSGRFDLEKDEISIDIDKGMLGVIPVNGAKLLFDRVVAKGKGGVDIKMNINTKLVNVLRYISKEPIALGEKIGMDLDKVKGTAALKINLNFPTQKDVKLSQFKIDISGDLADVALPDVIKDMDITGGPLAFVLKDGDVSLKGKAQLDNRPMDFSWSSFLKLAGKPYAEKITAKITADPNIRQKLGIDLSEFIEGSLPVNVTYTSYQNKTAIADVTADLTPARFFVEPFDFEKSAGKKGQVTLKAHLKNGDIERITALKGSGAGFELSGASLYFAADKSGKVDLSRGSVPSYRIGENRGKLSFVYDDKRALKLVLENAVLDARPFLEGDDEKHEYDRSPMLISVNADKMITGENVALTNAQMFFDIDNQGRFNQFELDGKLPNGSVFVRFKPDDEGQRSFRMKSDDAGGLLKAFGLYDNIEGGDLVIYGEPISGVFDRNLKGVAEISNFKVTKAPALAKLLSILSLTGIGEALASEGLAFDKLETSFNWLYRKNGSMLVMEEGRTSGNSLGLIFEGTLDNAKDEIDVSGTVVPMSGLNSFIGSIPLVGDILTGGSGGVFAATYSVSGDASDPNISVNPLSVLTPGILRRILWE